MKRDYRRHRRVSLRERDSPLSEYGSVNIEVSLFSTTISKFRLKEGLKWAQMSVNVFTYT